MWMYISIILFWFLCGSWAIRMEEKADDKVMRSVDSFIRVSIGFFALVITFCEVWLPRLWKFIKDIRLAWKQAIKGE